MQAFSPPLDSRCMPCLLSAHSLEKIQYRFCADVS